jgi:hypothetical protein
VTSEGSDTGGTPRWVKVFGLVAVVAVVVVVVVLIVGRGGHGPSRHSRGGDAPAGNTFGAHTGSHAGVAQEQP